MKILNRISLTQRLYGISAALILLLCAVAGVTWSSLSNIANLSREVGRIRVAQLDLISNSELNLMRARLEVRQALLAKPDLDVEKALDALQAARQKIADNDANFLKNVTAAEGRQAFSEWIALQQDAWPQMDKTISLIKQRKLDDARESLETVRVVAMNKLSEWLKAERNRQKDQLSATVADIDARAAKIRLELTITVLLIALGLIAFCWSTARHLNARAMALTSIAERLKDGNFTVPVSDDARDEFSALLGSMNVVQISLSSVVDKVRQNAENVAMASTQIAQGNTDLASRTEEQAGALQQTAASMDQLLSTVRKNTDNTRHADAKAANARDLAIRGGDVVNQVISTMDRIDDNAQKITEIIGVIDGIAFQTNILALNAAVEAARAGEQGRGFAVVAGEVRNLAQRSATAAKEIKELISTSVLRVKEGSTLVSNAGETMTEIITSSEALARVLKEITIASDEQQAGVDQVRQAVESMDATTQQNAALVEESAAAAQSLRHQAQSLVSTMSVFRLPDRETL